MEHENIFDCRELPSFFYDKAIIKADLHDGLFAMFFSDGTILCFDSISYIVLQMPDPDKSIKGSPSSISISPNHKFLAVGYNDGGIQLFDIEGMKAVKLISKPKKISCSSLRFLNDHLLISGDEEGNITSYKITIALKLITVRESQLASFGCPILSIDSPPVNKYIEKGQSKVLSTKFANVLGIATSTQFTLVNIEESFNVFAQIEAINPHSSFKLLDTDAIYLSISSDIMINIYKLTDISTPELTHSKSILNPAKFLCFLSNSILSVISDDSTCSFIQFVDHTFSMTKISHPGYYMDGTNCLVTFSNGKIFNYRLQAFTERIDRLDIKSAIVLCKNVMENDPTAVIGLPTNSAQRAIIIEKNLSKKLQYYTNDQLDHDGDPQKVTDYLIELSKELKMEDWLIEGGMSIFKEKNLLKQFFSQILKADPECIYFTYTSQFLSLLLENSEGLEISTFLLHLPSKIVSPEVLLQYGLKTKNTLLISEVYEKRLNNPIMAMTVLSNCKDWINVLQILFENINEETIDFIFARSFQKVTFPRAWPIINEGGLALLERLYSYVASNNMSLNDFLNNLLITLSDEDIPFSNHIYQYVEEKVILKNVTLSNEVMRYILTRIFIEGPDHDKRSALLRLVISSPAPFVFKESLIPLCDTFNFSEAKDLIQKEAKKFDSVIFEMMSPDSHSDVFEYIIKTGSVESEPIKQAIIANSDLLLSKDFEKTIDILITYFISAIPDFVASVKDTVLQNEIIRRLFLKQKYVIPYERVGAFVEYICEYFPCEVRTIIEKIDINPTEIIGVCEKHNIFDACAYLADQIGDMRRLHFFMKQFVTSELVYFADGEYETIDFDFVFKILTTTFKRKSNDPEQAIFGLDMVNAFIVPLFVLQEKSDFEKMIKVSSWLKRVCEIVSNSVTFPKMVSDLIQEFSELRVETVQQALIAVVNDYTYDIDMFKSLVTLIRGDERKSNAQLIAKTVHGIQVDRLSCGSCHKQLNGVQSKIRIFSCGHAFHDNPNCLPQNDCPVCFPNELVVTEPVKIESVVTENTMKRVLRRFEMRMGSEAPTGLRNRKEDKIDAIDMRPVSSLK